MSQLAISAVVSAVQCRPLWTKGATISNPAHPQVADSGTAPRYRSQVIILADQLAIAVEDEVGQAGGAAVLFKCLLNLVKELSGESRYLNNLYPCCSAGSPEGWAATGRSLKWKKTTDNWSSQCVCGRLTPPPPPVEMMKNKRAEKNGGLW